MNNELTATLSRFASGIRLEDIPGRVREYCKDLTLDALACALAGHQGEDTSKVSRFAAQLAQSQESTVIGGGKLSLSGATMFNGFLITAVSMCDVYRPTATHLQPVIVSPALAIAERDDASGRDLLVALVSGFETAARIAAGVDYGAFRKRGWHGPGTIGPFGPRPRWAACWVSIRTRWPRLSVSPEASRQERSPRGEHRRSSSTSSGARCRPESYNARILALLAANRVPGIMFRRNAGTRDRSPFDSGACRLRSGRTGVAVAIIAALAATGAASQTTSSFDRSSGGSGQAYPAKPIRVIVPYAAGGSLEAIGRIYAAALAETLGQQLVIDSRPGANGNVGSEMVVKSAPDGYTLLLGASSSLTINPSLYRMRYDAQRDLAPISLVGMQRNILTIHPSLPARSVKQFIELAKSRPGALNFASTGRGSSSHMSCELFKSVTGVDMVHIPYKGNGPATVDLVAGHVAVMFNNLAIALPFVKNGRLRALAVTGATRSPAIPELPTMGEAGYPSVDVSLWEALLAPAATPSDVIARLNTEVVKAGSTAEVQQRLSQAGVEVATSTPGELRMMLKNDTLRWAQVVKKAGLAIE